MFNLHICFIFFGLTIVSKCQPGQPTPDLSAPTYSLKDSIYNGVFAPWDGIWTGQFTIYSNPSGQKQRLSGDDIRIDSTIIKKFELSQIIQVYQKYQSITPYYQKVEITDTYLEKNDTVTIESYGVNKVQDGELWCLVKKPKELVVHKGIWDKPNTLIWHRYELNPLRKEYFVEEVLDNYYTIMGYGYYGDDNPDLEPRTWFYAKYHHLSDYFR